MAHNHNVHVIEGINIILRGDGDNTKEAAQAYYIHCTKNRPKLRENLLSIVIQYDGDYANIDYTVRRPPFERIRRITGYLVGTTDRWNNAKCAELEDRVTHDNT